MAKTRQEIDKEIMFSKIMPSSLTAPEPDSFPLPEDGRAAYAEDEPPAPLRERTAPDKQPRGLLPPDKGVQLVEKNQQMLVNLMEYLVIDKLDVAFAKFNCCKCDKCRKDVAAIALNKLAPKYVVLDPDQIPLWVERQGNAEAMTAIVQGILQVRSKPRH